MSKIDLFIDARQYLVDSIEPMIETYLCGIWDPYCKFTIMQEVDNIINRDLLVRFPHLPKKYFPNVKFRIYNDEELTEVNIQRYFNKESMLNFLGTIGLGDEVFDLYFRESFDPRFNYVFVARYGHGFDEYYSGSKTARAEYYMGMPTPLSLAYGMAKDDGII